jgi:type IV pilus assembly protein PilC
VRTYTYTAKNTAGGELVSSDVQAENEQAAAKLLMGQGLFPITIDEQKEKGAGGSISFLNRVSTKDRVLFTRQLSTLINAGLPLIQSLRTATEQVSNKTFQEIMKKVIASVEGGSSLSAAFGEFPKVFNQIYVALVAAGETSGTLDKALERLANQQEKDAAIASKIRGALIYPFIVLGVVIAVVIFMLTTLLPQVSSLYKDLKKTLPISTRILVSISNVITHFWWLVIILLVGLGYGLMQYIKSEPGRYQWDGLKLHIPIFGPLFRKVYMARFARTLSTLLASGIPMLEGLAIVEKAVSNAVVAQAIQRIIDKVRSGKALSESILAEPSFIPLVGQMSKIGEESGALDDMLGRVASFYESEVDTAVQNLSTIIEPVLMVFLGLVVGGVIVAVLLPVYGLVGQGLN